MFPELPTWSAVKRLPELGFPRSFPIVQFPNLPLAAGLVAGLVANLTHGTAHSYAMAVSYLGIAIWAYEELTEGVNWFRRALGLAFLAMMLVRVAHALQ
jgi:hypothetical protein